MATFDFSLAQGNGYGMINFAVSTVDALQNSTLTNDNHFRHSGGTTRGWSE
jgi:hypothetical protein